VATRWHHQFIQDIDNNIFQGYMRNKLIVYDETEHPGDVYGGLAKVEQTFRDEYLKEESYKSLIKYPMFKFSKEGGHRNHAEFIAGNSDRLRVLKYDANSIKIRTSFDEPKVLVYNDSFHSRWQAFVNGQKTDIIRANAAFKGVWLPAGENIVNLRYGSVWLYVWNYFLLSIFYGIFGLVIVSGIKAYRNEE